ncbi:MAG: 2-keto-4-pentenoate hydratase [Acidimicrobiales bacterium]
MSSPDRAPSEDDLATLTARLLADRARGDFAPAWLNGAIDLDQALDLQLAVLEDRLSAGDSVGGWKVGLTSEASRRKLGADERPFGYVLASRTLETAQTLAAADVNRLSIETEMCFTIGSDITDPNITPDRVLDHIEAVAAGFELNEARPGSARPDFCAMVTDCLTNWGIVGGPGVAPTGADGRSVAADLSATVITMDRNGEELFSGVSSDHCDDHTISLCRLVDQLAHHGRMLQAGQKVITCAFARFPAEAGDQWRATYSGPAFPEPVSVEITIV